jgi:hypothetical protein
MIKVKIYLNRLISHFINEDINEKSDTSKRH